MKLSSADFAQSFFKALVKCACKGQEKGREGPCLFLLAGLSCHMAEGETLLAREDFQRLSLGPSLPGRGNESPVERETSEGVGRSASFVMGRTGTGDTPPPSSRRPKLQGQHETPLEVADGVCFTCAAASRAENKHMGLGHHFKLNSAESLLSVFIICLAAPPNTLYI